MAATVETPTYAQRRGEIEHYFDRTAVEAWSKLTSDAPLTGIRATVRQGRDAMRQLLFSLLPEDLSGQRVLDAGCGTGAGAVMAAQRGADVVAVDLSPRLIELAYERLPGNLGSGSLTFVAGDMLSPGLGEFDHVIAMDSLIHYRQADVIGALAQLAPRVRGSLVFTFAPWNPLLAAMHLSGRLLPQGNRAPDICPIRPERLLRALGQTLTDWRVTDTQRISTGFYKSQAVGVCRA